MKYSILASLISVLCSCGTIKNQNPNSESKNNFAPFTGTIHLNESGCPYFIDVEQVLVSNWSSYLGKKLYPVQLEDKFKKNGLKLNFNLTVSRAPSPADCQIDYVVSLSNLSISKK